MYSEKISLRQLSAWLFAAIVPVTIQLTSGAAWPGVFLVTVVSFLGVWLRKRWGKVPGGKIYPALLWLTVVCLIASLAQETIHAWPIGGHMMVPIILLGLALWSALKGPKAVADVSGLLFWLFLILFLLLFGAGVRAIEPRWLLSKQTDVSPLGCVLLLTPLLSLIHLKKECDKKISGIVVMGVFCVAASVITSGVLSPAIAASTPYPFYEMTRSLTVLGQARRFEAILSAGTTIGWYALFSLYLSVCGNMAERMAQGWGRKGIVLAAVVAIVLMLSQVIIPDWILLLLAVFLWLIIPLIAGLLGIEKKSEKSKKTS